MLAVTKIPQIQVSFYESVECFRVIVLVIMRAAVGYAVAFVAQWQDLEKSLLSSSQRQPIVIDSALFPEKPNYSNERPTLFRER